MDKKTLGIFICALIVVSSFALFSPNAKGDPSDIKVLSYSWYISQADSYTSLQGELVVVGEIQNIGSSIIGVPWVNAVAYSADGAALAAAYNPAYVNYMLPQQKAPFYLVMGETSVDPNGNYTGLTWVPLVDHVEISIGYSPNATEDEMYRGVSISGKTAFNMNGVYTVTGIILNNGSETAGRVWTVTTFYDSSQTVVAVNFTDFLTDQLAPSKTVSFSATPMDNAASLSTKIDSYSVIVQEMPAEPNVSASPSPSISTSPLPTSSPTVLPSNTGTPSQSPGTNQPALSDDLIYALVGAAVIVVLISVMLLVRRRR